MNKADRVVRLRDATGAARLSPSEVEHMLDLMADWGWLALDDEPAPANAQLEGAEAEPTPAHHNNEMMIEPVTHPNRPPPFDLEEDYEEEEEGDPDKTAAPRRKSHAKAKPAHSKAKPAPRRHR
jgi:hypothetical protein